MKVNLNPIDIPFQAGEQVCVKHLFMIGVVTTQKSTMLTILRFFVYDNSDRHTAHHLHADMSGSLLADFRYGERLSITEQFEGSTAKKYVVADLPFRKQQTSNLPGMIEQTIDVYLVPEEKWNEFTPDFSSIDNPWHGPTL
ncbi:hypothetical protein [Larkinella terrae]|uniref:Uncharacterized protein n=1 Tax=Larkinella terrae TaxID=2025311 RepID=A0A7K0EJL8_9BACT|nr:hypothetical protein [Larkinella terrae]MRS61656.1 hypothetical protein [Larkinella terrae]